MARTGRLEGMTKIRRGRNMRYRWPRQPSLCESPSASAGPCARLPVIKAHLGQSGMGDARYGVTTTDLA